MMVTILLVADSRLVRDRLRDAISAMPEAVAVAEADDEAGIGELLRELSKIKAGASLRGPN